MRRTRSKSISGISLFPFLAVLICTMGALIVLLVLVMQQARVHAETVATARQSGDAAEQARLAEQRQLQAEDEQWRGDILREQREQVLAQLAEKRLQLAHLEEHIREIQQRFADLQDEVGNMQQLSATEQADRAALLAEKERLVASIAEAERAVEAAQKRAAERPRTFTIIPYPGPNGTERRPIYIECTEQGIVLRPENIVLSPDDFEGPLGPGNPLDAALRTMREFYMQHAPTGSEPYPLLIIRPDGVGAYAAAREAMNGWDDEFGYELVSAELLLNYPPPDPNLAARVQQAIRDARERQARLRMAMPAYPRGTGFVVSGRGGVVPVDGVISSGSSGGNRGAGSGSGGAGTGAGSSQGDATATSQGGTAGQLSGRTNGNSRQGAGQATPGAGESGGGATSLGSMAKTRGQDWALDKKSSGATGYRRPVRVVCQREAIVLMPEQGSNQPPQTFPFDTDPTRTMDAFVQSLQKRMANWGLAPLGGYWRPQVIMDVAPDAGERYLMLDTLLRDSGLELVRNQP